MVPPPMNYERMNSLIVVAMKILIHSVVVNDSSLFTIVKKTK